MKTSKFSLLELLVVIFVIAMLFALLLPSIQRARKMAHTALCQKNLKDLHSLLMSYAVDHDNTLPGSAISDFEGTTSGNSGSYNGFYANWSGHLIPYIDTSMDYTKWKKQVRLKYDGKWYTNGGSLASSATLSYQIMNDSLTGSGVFRMMYCPEVINSIVDPGLYYLAGTKNKSFEAPKIYFLTNEYGSYGNAFIGSNYVQDGLPTTYTANDDLMHSSAPKKISELSNFGKKLVLTEGGNCTSDQLAHSKISARRGMHYEDFGFNMVHNKQSSYENQMLTFPHDEEKEYWHSEQGIFTLNRPKANLYNEMCNANAYVAPNRDYYGALNAVASGAEETFWMEFITHENPYTTTKYRDIMKQVLGWNWGGSFKYVGDAVRYLPGTGKSNVLYGDGRVATEHAAWLFVNRAELLWASDVAD